MIDNALLDSLWQGALVAALGGCATLLVPRRNAATRYAVWFASLLALAIVPFATLWQPAPSFGPIPNVVVHSASSASRATQQIADAGGRWLTILWLCGVAICLARLAISYIRIVRMVRSARPAPELGSDVLVSEELTIPVAVGFFSPVVILPSAVASTFERGDVESILRHERAHVARKDVAGNFVQRMVEALFFFNPWAYLIGRQLMKEREAACDDWVVHGDEEPDRYATCLARLARGTRSAASPLLTPSAIGSRSVLVGRIARLLDGKEAILKTNYLAVAGSVAAFALLAFALQVPNARVAAATPNPNFPPKCFHDVQVLNAVPPNISKADFKPNAESNAVVDVDPQGRPISARTVKSSGSAAIDRATIEAAMHTTYSPEVMNCKPKAGEYLFHVELGPS